MRICNIYFLAGIAVTVSASLVMFFFSYYLKPYLDKMKRVKKIKRSQNNQTTASKQAAVKESWWSNYITTPIQDYFVPLIVTGFVGWLVWSMFSHKHTRSTGHTDGFNWWWVITPVLLVIVVAILASLYNGKFNLSKCGIKKPNFSIASLSSLSWYFQAAFIVGLIVLAVIGIGYWWPHAKDAVTAGLPSLDENRGRIKVADPFPAVQTVTYGKNHFKKSVPYKFLMLGRDVPNADEHYFTQTEHGTRIFSFKKIDYENTVYWSYKVTNNGHDPVDYRLLQNQNEGTGGWIEVTVNETCDVDITKDPVLN